MGQIGGLTRRLSEIGGRRLPFLRWSVWRMAFGGLHLLKDWQVGDGREEAVADHVIAHARKGDIDDAIRVIDDFCYHRSVLMNVGDEKGEILDQAVRQLQPRRLLELGTYCGYSALRMARVMPEQARLCSIEFSQANADVARRIWDHAGLGDRVSVVVGSLGDGGHTMARLEAEHGLSAGTLDFLFIDHDKRVYLPDLQRVLDQGWLHAGSVVVADNVKFPGAPKYRAYMNEQEGTGWRTIEHATHAEYQTLIKDLVLESTYLGAPEVDAP
jgi:catechol O-methyltransferase